MPFNTTPDSFTKLLIHSDTSDGSTTFVDSSDSGHTVTATNANHTSSLAKFGDTSMHFDGSGDNLNISANADFDFGTGNFTIDFWYARAGAGDHNNELIYANRDGSGDYFKIYYNLSDKGIQTQLYVSSTLTQENFSTDLTSDTGWHHYALVRTGVTWYWYLDGVSQTLTTNTSAGTTVGVSNKHVTIGSRDWGWGYK